MSLIAASSDCWNKDRLAKMKFDLSPGEKRDPNLAQFSNLVKCLEQEQGRSSGVGNMDWRQWQNVAQSNDLSNVWNRQTPAWTRPGDQRPPMQGPGYNQGYNNNPSGQPRPGVHPDDWNNRQPGTGSGYPGNNMNWPQQGQDGGNNRDRDRDREVERRRKERRRNRNQNRRKDPNNDRQNNEVFFSSFFINYYVFFFRIFS